MEPTNTMEAQPEAAPVINQPEEPMGLTCDQCGETGFKNKLGLAMHKARLRGDAKHPNPSGTVRPPPHSSDPEVRREYARKRYLRVKRERERQKSLAAASAAARQRRVRPEEGPRVEVGEIVEHPRACPRCGMDLEAITAAMNLRRK